MAVWNLGSVNLDRFYHLARFPAAGETLACESFSEGLGGKGANMSVAAARAGARVCHIGVVGQDGVWARDRLLEYGVDTRHIKVGDVPTGHANICIDGSGENQIVLFPGGNQNISAKDVAAALSEAATDDILLFQNETNGQEDAVRLARQLGLRVVYAAAPFDVARVSALLGSIDVLVMNDVEAKQLQSELGIELMSLEVPHVIVTRGGDGADWIDTASQSTTHMKPYPVTPVDTTGAGDTFTGFFVAGLDRNMPMQQALDLAGQAGALMVTRKGTADVIPDLKEIEDARLAQS